MFCFFSPLSLALVNHGKAMMDHEEERSRDPLWEVEQNNTVRFIRERLGLAEDFSEQEINHVIGNVCKLLDVEKLKSAAQKCYSLIYDRTARGERLRGGGARPGERRLPADGAHVAQLYFQYEVTVTLKYFT